MANILTPKVSSNLVFLYKPCNTLFASAPFLNSSTILIPSFEDWLEISVISGIFFVSTNVATSLKNFPMLAPIIVYGISVITIRSFSDFFSAFSITAFPRSLIFPLPVS